MGGGGIVIIRNKRLTIEKELTVQDELALNEISSRSAVGCSMADALRVVRIVWRLIRP